jgi:hypothetical protein
MDRYRYRHSHPHPRVQPRRPRHLTWFGLTAAGLAAATAAAVGCVHDVATDGPSAVASSTSALSGDGGGPAARGALVISQVYSGGGLDGSTFDHDFVELLNVSGAPITLDGFSLQVAGPDDDLGSAANAVVALSGTIAAQKYLLVALGGGGVSGTPLPAADLSGSVDLATGAGKVALSPTTDPLACGGTAGSRCSTTKVIDEVGYGLVSDFEGTQPTLPLTNTTAAIRKNGGCTDTNDNRKDFTVDTPAPLNSGSDPAACPTPPVTPQKEAGGPPPPVLDPPLGAEVGGDDSGAARRDAGGNQGGGASGSGCSVGPVGRAWATGTNAQGGTSNLGESLPLLAGLVVLVRRRRRRRRA